MLQNIGSQCNVRSLGKVHLAVYLNSSYRLGIEREEVRSQRGNMLLLLSPYVALSLWEDRRWDTRPHRHRLITQHVVHSRTVNIFRRHISAEERWLLLFSTNRCFSWVLCMFGHVHCIHMQTCMYRWTDLSMKVHVCMYVKVSK